MVQKKMARTAVCTPTRHKRKSQSEVKKDQNKKQKKLVISAEEHLTTISAEEVKHIFDLIHPDKFDLAELTAVYTFLESVVFPRIKPVVGGGWLEYFTDTPHHLDVAAWTGAKKKDGRCMVPHRNPVERKKKKKSTLHVELYQIFCPPGFECPEDKRLCHRRQYAPTPDERAAGITVGQTCRCANPHHVVSDTQRQNDREKYSHEGCARQCGESNGNTNTTNVFVADLRAQVWEMANLSLVGSETPCHSSGEERASWTADDPRWDRLHRWRLRHRTWGTRMAAEMGVHVRTIQNYVVGRTFTTSDVVRQKFEPTVRTGRWRLYQAERKLGFKIRDLIPTDELLTPKYVPSLETALGTPSGDESTYITQVITRYIRRSLNASVGRGPKERRSFVSDGNLSVLITRLKGCIWEVANYRVKKWVASTCRWSDPPPVPDCLVFDVDEMKRRVSQRRELGRRSAACDGTREGWNPDDPRWDTPRGRHLLTSEEFGSCDYM